MHSKIEQFHVAVVGAGVVGLGTAWAAQQLGLKTILLERSRRAEGASIRNFGLLLPIGQPTGIKRQLAIRNRELWMRLSREADIWLQPCGSLHLAHHDDEWQVLQEFAQLPEESDQGLELLAPAETNKRTQLANPDGLRGSLFSPLECRVAPRHAIEGLANYLARLGVTTRFGESIVRVDGGILTSSTGDAWQANHVFVCSGADFANLFPKQHAAAKIRICKLHMLRTPPLASGASIGPHLASGLSLRHYESFRHCKSLSEVQQRITRESPELDQYGIHVMVSQDADGHLVLGDSHEYDSDIDPFNHGIIDDLILRELRKVYALPNWDINARWTGIYAKHTQAPWLELKPEPNVTIINGFGGAGMSLSLAVTEQIVSSQFAGAV